METEGSIATTAARNSSKSVTVDRKAVFMVQELRKFGLRISETKWFGQDKYEVDGYLILHSGHPVPRDNDVVERNEGVV